MGLCKGTASAVPSDEANMWALAPEGTTSLPRQFRCQMSSESYKPRAMGALIAQRSKLLWRFCAKTAF